MSNNFIWMKTVWNVDLIWCHLLVLDSFFVSIHFIIAKLSAVDRPSPEVRSYIDAPPAAVFTLHLCFLTDSTKSAALSRLNEIIYDFNVLQSCPTDRRLSVETLRSLHWETLIHMFRSWDDKSLISLLPNKKKRLANDMKQAVLGCRSAAVCHQCFSSYYLHRLSLKVRSWLAVNNFPHFSLFICLHTVLLQPH